MRVVAVEHVGVMSGLWARRGRHVVESISVPCEPG